MRTRRSPSDVIISQSATSYRGIIMHSPDNDSLKESAAERIQKELAAQRIQVLV
jgi:hypothetical protein